MNAESEKTDVKVVHALPWRMLAAQAMTLVHAAASSRVGEGEPKMSFNKKFLKIYPVDRVTVLHLGEMEIWDGADMALLRETLTNLIEKERRRAIGIDMTYVKYIPGGFFGMLFDWHEQGVSIHLYTPQPNVRRMLWFDRFFEPRSEFEYELRPERADEFPLGFAEEEAGMMPGSVMNLLLSSVAND